MRAVSYHGPSRIVVEDKPLPRIEHPADAILRVTRTAICGSDLHLYHGWVPDTRVGHTFGHEFMGIVEEVGPAVKRLRPGMKVLVPFNISCGSCFFCDKGLTASCENVNPNSETLGGVFGYSHLTGGYDGGQAEYVRVPFADVGPFEVPNGVEDEKVLFLTDIYPTGYQAAEMGMVGPGDTVVVFGCGPVGLFAMKSAWLMGAARVIGVDKEPYRMEMARTFAGVETVDFSDGDVVTALRDMTGGRGADVCIDAVGLEATGSILHGIFGALLIEAGRPTALGWAIDSARRGGRISIVGVYGPPWNMINMGAAMNKGLTLRMGQCNVRRYIPRLLEHVLDGHVDPSAIITHRLPLEAAPEAYKLFARKEDNCMKCVLVPHAA